LKLICSQGSTLSNFKATADEQLLVFNDKNEFQYVYRGPKSLAAFLLLFNRLVPFGLETPRRDCLRGRHSGCRNSESPCSLWPMSLGTVAALLQAGSETPVTMKP
jgi:hypothetical protein